MDFEISALTPMFEARDLEETIASYTNTLGFWIENRLDDADGKPCWRGRVGRFDRGSPSLLT